MDVIVGNTQEDNKYDLICSLGGSCAAAHNMRMRDLRFAAYPFDCTYFTTDEAIYKLAEGFKNKFEKYMLKENLVELPINPSHPDRMQLEDSWGKIIWANQFNYSSNFDKTYSEVKKKFDKRFKRLLNNIESAKRICFILCTSFYLKQDSVQNLLKTLQELYPNKEFQIKVVSFDCENEEHIKRDNIEIFCYTRKLNVYDFDNTNFEWAFMDKLKLTKKNRCKISFKLFGYKIKISWSK